MVYAWRLRVVARAGFIEYGAEKEEWSMVVDECVVDKCVVDK